MHDDSHFPQCIHFLASTRNPFFMVMACFLHFFAHIPHEVHICALRSALTLLSKRISASFFSLHTTETCPPPKSLAVPVLVFTSAISNSSEYFTSPTVLKASSTEEKSLFSGYCYDSFHGESACRTG